MTNRADNLSNNWPGRVNSEPLSPVSYLARSVRIYPEKTAVVYGARRYSYREFQDRVLCLAAGLRAHGIGHGDKVVFICPNIPPLLEAHFAVPMLGAVLVVINTQLSAEEYRYIIEHSDAKALFIDSEFSERLRPVMSSLSKVSLVVNIYDTCFTSAIQGLDFDSLIATAAPDSLRLQVNDENAVLAINYTSGTTGRPKGVMCSHRSLALHTLGEIIESDLCADSVYLWTLPMFHCNGWGFPWAVTAAGATNVCIRRNQPGEIFSLIEQEKVSHLCAAPNLLLSLISSPGGSSVRLRRRLRVLTAGAAPSRPVIEGMEEIGADVTHVYGLTELHGPHAACVWQPQWVELDPELVGKMKARQGVAYLTSLHLEVVDPQTMQPVPHDGATIGEVVMRGNNVMLGYYRDEAATREAFRDGWFHSGDLGVIHPDGYLQIVDRVSDVIVRDGNMISSLEIEEIIHQHPDVLEVAVVASPDPLLGEVPKAFVVPRRGASVKETDIVEFCRRHIDSGRLKSPLSVEFGQLPKTATGKTIKAQLRNREWSVESEDTAARRKSEPERLKIATR